MRQKTIIGITLLCIVVCFQLTGCSDDKPMVDYGSESSEENAGIQEVELEGIFDAQDYIEPGLTTIIEFCTNDCIGCKRLQQHYKRFLEIRPDVAIRRFLVPNNWQPKQIWNNYQVDVGAIPHIIIYSPDGELIAQDEGRDKDGFNFLYKWMNDEIKKDWEERNKK